MIKTRCRLTTIWMFFLLEVEIQTAVETETHVATRDKIKMSDCLWKKKKDSQHFPNCRKHKPQVSICQAY